MAALLIVAAARVGPELTEALTNQITWMFTRLAADRASITTLNILRRVSADGDRVDAHRSPLGRRITAVSATPLIKNRQFAPQQSRAAHDRSGS